MVKNLFFCKVSFYLYENIVQFWVHSLIKTYFCLPKKKKKKEFVFLELK